MAVEDILNVVYSVMGNKPHKHNTTTGQISYNCMLCDSGRNRGKLEINYKKLVMKCWSCGSDSSGVKGTLYSLIEEYGSKKDAINYKKGLKDFIFTGTVRQRDYIPNIYLPKEYKPITPNNVTYSMKMAYDYLKRRGLSDEEIIRYKIGYCDSGDYWGRVIIPSYDNKGKLNFFVGRSYMGSTNKYKNPEILKNEIIPNSSNINWDSTIYLVEGMFDLIGIGAKNTIPLLGKVISDKLLETLIANAKGYIVIALDPDAKKDAYKLYKKLESYYHISDRIRIIELPLNMDWSKIKEEYGVKGIRKCLRRMKTLNVMDLINNSAY